MRAAGFVRPRGPLAAGGAEPPAGPPATYAGLDSWAVTSGFSLAGVLVLPSAELRAQIWQPVSPGLAIHSSVRTSIHSSHPFAHPSPQCVCFPCFTKSALENSAAVPVLASDRAVPKSSP